MLIFLHLILIKTILAHNFFNVLEKSSFDACFMTIADKYLHKHTNVFLGPKFNDINFPTSKPFKIGNSTEFLLENVEESAVSYSISYNHIDELNTTFTDIGTSNVIHYILIANEKVDVIRISEHLWQFRLYKSVILLPSKFKLNVYVIDLKNSKCGTYIKPKKINECRFGKFKKELNLFNPNMKKCFYNCPIRIIWSKYTPWIFDNEDSESGIYRDILTVFEETCHFNIIYMPESEVYSEELAFYNFGSIIADFDSDYADVFVGLVGFSASSAYVWTTGVIYEDDMYFVIPNPKIIPHWKMIYKLFLPSIWLLSSVLFVIVCTLFTLLALTTVIDRSRFGNFVNNSFYMYSLIVSIGLYKFPRSFKLRSFLGIYLLTAIISVAVMQGRYYSITNRPIYEKRITNLEELLNSDVPIKSSEGLRLLFMFALSNPKYAKILQRMEILPSRDLAVNLKRAYHENFATVTDSGLLIMNPYLKSAMQVFEIYSFVTCFLMQKNHVLYEFFTKNLTTIVESGFLDKSVSYMKFKYSRHQYFKEENRVVRFTLTHVEGPFFVLAGGYVATLLGFALEHIYFYYRTKPKKTNYRCSII